MKDKKDAKGQHASFWRDMDAIVDGAPTPTARDREIEKEVKKLFEKFAKKNKMTLEKVEDLAKKLDDPAYRAGIDLEKLADDIDRFKPAREIPRKRKGVTVTERVPPDGMSALEAYMKLEAHVRANWTIREILFFDDFTHGGTYDAGKGWRMSFAGYVADTARWQGLVIGLFKRLCREANFFMGMKRCAEMGADVPPVFGWTRLDTGENSPLDLTLNALIRSIPSKARK